MNQSARVARPDPAVEKARAVVGLYGDPEVSWSIMLTLTTNDVVRSADVQRRWAAMVSAHPHLGRVGQVIHVDDDNLAQVQTEFLNAPYGDHDPLLRVALSVGGRMLVVAAHHGAVDGLGLLGAAGALLARPIGTRARGITRTGAEAGFLRGTAGRLGEVLLRPPARFDESNGEPGATGDHLVLKEVSLARTGTAALVWAGHRALLRWNGGRSRLRQPVVALGISRRGGTPPLAPTRDTAYARVRTRGVTRDSIEPLLAGIEPEPDFPARRPGRVALGAIRMMSGRLGASLLVSNLGRVEGEVRDASIWPAPSGPHGIAVGLASAGDTTLLSVRARRGWFDRRATERIAALVAEELGQYGS